MKTEKPEKTKIESKSGKSLIHIVDGPDSLKLKYNGASALRTPDGDSEEEENQSGLNGNKTSGANTRDEFSIKKLRKGLLIATVILASLTLIIVIVNEIFYQINNQKTREKLAELQKSVLLAAEAQNKLIEDGKKNGTTENQGSTDVVQPTGPVLLPEYESLYYRNNDLVGWIQIDDTEINYPVMQTKWNNEYYLERDFDCNDDKNGLPFVDNRSDVFKPTTNILIYGHSMNSGLMFAALLKYKDESFFKKHPVIKFDTVYEHGEYEIVAAFQSRIADKDENTFRYYTFFDTDSEAEFNSYIDNIKKLSYYDTGVKATFGDQLITLSTCDREIKDGRMVIVARKITTD